MPISSTDVSNIIGGQIGMFSASAQYAQAISAQYGFSPHGSPFGADPRMSGGIGMAGGMASATANAPGMAMGGLGMMAMFNQAPRALDPFTGSMHAAAMGYRGAGIGGAVGMGMGAMGAYAGIGAAGGWVTNQIATGAQNRAMTMGAVQNIMPNQGMSGLNMMAGQVEGMARQGMGSIRELTGVMQGGAMSGALDTSTLSQFSMSFNKLVNNVRNVATALNTSMQQAQQAMQQVKSIGINSDQAAGFLGTARAFGASTGISPQQMMGYAAGGSSFARQAGIDRSVGASGAITQAGIYGLALKQGLPGILPDSYSRHMQGASRFLMGGRGRAVLGAMFDPQTGGIDPMMAQRIAGGFMSRSDMMSASRANLAGNADLFGSRRGELAATFMSQYGPSGVAGALDQMTSTSSRPGMLQQSLTGLNRRDIEGMRQLRTSASGLQSQLMAAARTGFQEGSQQQTFSSALGQAWEQFTKPIKDEFRQIGAQMTQAYSGAVDTMMGEFSRSRGVRFNPGSARNYEMNMMTNPEFARMSRAMRPGMAGPSYITDNTPGDSWAGQLASRLPSAFRFGRYAPGTSISELPFYGMGTDTYSPTQTLMAGATALNIGGRNPYGWAGHALERAGAGIQALGGTPSSTGFLGSGGIGGPGSLMRMAGGIPRGLGYGMKGLGFLSKVASPAIIGADLLTNAGPAGMRAYGMSPISAGAITGNEARMFRALTDAGALGDEGFQDLRIGSLAGGIDTAPAGMTPLSGFVGGGGGGGGGTQRFITRKGIEKFEQIYSEAGAEEAHRKLKDPSGKAISAAKILRVAKAQAAVAGGDWDSLSSGDQLLKLTEAAQGLGASMVTTGDALAIFKDTPGAIKDVIRAQHEKADPQAMLDKTYRQNRDKMLIGQAEMMRTGTGNQKASKLDPQSKTDMFAALQRRVGKGFMDSQFLFKSHGLDTSEDYEKQLQFIKQHQHLSGLLPPGIGTKEEWEEASTGKNAYKGINKHVENIDPAIGGAAVFATNKTAYQGLHSLRYLDMKGLGSWKAGGKEQGRRGRQHGMTSALLGGENALAFSQAVMAARMGDIDKKTLIQKMYGMGAKKFAVDRDDIGTDFNYDKYATALIQDDEYRDVMFGAGAQQQAEYMKYRGDLRESFGTTGPKREKREMMGDLAIRAGGGSGVAVDIYRGIQKSWITDPSDLKEGERGGRLHARQDFVRNLQTRLAGGVRGAKADSVQAATEAGGVLDNEGLQNMYDQLMQSDNPVHQDMAGTLANFMSTRSATRTKGGKARTFDKILGKYGVKLSREDKRYVKDPNNNVMSTDLENDLRVMATRALQSQFGETPSPAAVTARTRELVNAIKSKDGNKWEEIVSTAGNPGGVAQGTGGGKQHKPGAISGVVGEFVTQVGLASKALSKLR